MPAKYQLEGGRDADLVSLILEGKALHCGQQVRAELSPCSGSTYLVQGGVRALLSELGVVRTDQGVCVANSSGSLKIDLVEHLFAALTALNAREGVRIEVHGSELPLLDGGSARWFDALTELGVGTSESSLCVLRRRTFDLGASRYRFEPGRGVALDVEVDFGARIGRQRAEFDGSPRRFRQQIAVARTFGFRRDHDRLLANGRARGVDLDSVLVFDDDGSLAVAVRPPGERELAEHKLLDLMGDAFLYGGLPRGKLSVLRPGHGANHAVFALALREGVIGPIDHGVRAKQ